MASSATKDFSRWLVVSDIDGTLNDKFRRLPDRNLKAIEKLLVNQGISEIINEERNDRNKSK